LSLGPFTVAGMPDDQGKRDKERARATEAATLLDPRIADLWAAIWCDQGESVPLDVVGALLRLAYLTGYQDALTEQDRGSLFKTLGLPVPTRIRPGPASRRAPR